MYLRSDIDITKFLSNVMRCEEAVFFYSEVGDTLNLNSVLSQYVFLARIDSSDEWKYGKIHCVSEKDRKLLKTFLCKEAPE